MARTVYVDGAYVDEADAKVSIFDRGYLFADGVYEVTSVLGGKMVDAEPHFDRLDRSLNELEIAWPCSRDDLIKVHRELIRLNEVDQGGVYMQITRGVADRDFTYPKDTASVLTAFTQARNLIDHPKVATGVSVISMPDIRWRRRDIKSIALLAQAMCKQAAAEQGAYEGWMVEDGHVTEGTSSTSYIVKGDTVITRPISNAVLAGVTRRTVLRLMAETGIGLDERPFSLEEAYDADEAFMTSASSFVLPIVEIDGRMIGGGQPGPVARRLREIYIEEAQQTAI